MSMFGDDERGRSKNDLYDEMVEFMNNYSPSELLYVVTSALKDYEDNHNIEHNDDY